MPTFPTTENDIMALAHDIANGLDVNSLVYVTPPVTFEAINDAITDFISKRDAITTVQAAATAATTAKDASLDDLVAKLKKTIRYAVNVTDGDDDQLRLIGWAGRRARAAAIAPSQPPLLEVEAEGPGSVSLIWQKPVLGGSPASYKVERRPIGSETWTLAGLATDNLATLTEQPRGESLEYRVVAVNKVGDSPGSNAVSAVL